MGKGEYQRKNDADAMWASFAFDTDSVISDSTFDSDLELDSDVETLELEKDSVLDKAVDALFEKRASTRESALELILCACRSKVQHEFVENNFATLLRQCLSSIKKGSAKETILASHVIGFLALNTGPGEKAREILEESISPILKALKSKPETSISALLECLAIITFIGKVEPEETEKLMKTLWQAVDPEPGSNVVSVKPSPHTITSAVSAWSFLLTTMNCRTINLNDWQESIHYLSCLLDKDDRSVRIASGKALALIFEMGNLERFSGEATNSSESSSPDGASAQQCTHIQVLMEKILNQVRSLSMEAGGKGRAKKDLKSQRNTFRAILGFLEDGHSPKTTMKIGKVSLNTTTWSQLIQINNLKHFIGEGFVKQMQDNEFRHDIFGFCPRRPATEICLTDFLKGMYKSPNLLSNKERGRLLKQLRLSDQYTIDGGYTEADPW